MQSFLVPFPISCHQNQFCLLEYFNYYYFVHQQNMILSSQSRRIIDHYKIKMTLGTRVIILLCSTSFLKRKLKTLYYCLSVCNFYSFSSNLWFKIIKLFICHLTKVIEKLRFDAIFVRVVQKDNCQLLSMSHFMLIAT